MKGFGYFLDCERVGGGACAEPKNVDTRCQRQLYVTGGSYFCGSEHPGCFFNLGQPLQAGFATTLKAAWTRARFP